MTLFDALILCRFYRDLITWKDLQEIVRAACGLSLKKTELRAMASGIINLARSFNQREGVTKKEDKLPRRFHREVLRETGKTIRPEDLDVMLKEYYQLRMEVGLWFFEVPDPSQVIIVVVVIEGLFLYLNIRSLSRQILNKTEEEAFNLSETIRLSIRNAMIKDRRDEYQRIIDDVAERKELPKSGSSTSG
jgi:hypothetical protein